MSAPVVAGSAALVRFLLLRGLNKTRTFAQTNIGMQLRLNEHNMLYM